jgi:L-seryl-tRNA(Ser) seleniumtransferase
MTAATSETKADRRLRLPSVHAVLDTAEAGLAVERFGRSRLVAAVRAALAAARTAGAAFSGDAGSIAAQAVRQLETQAQSSLRPVFNLTGTVLHTNLGRALLAETAIAAAVAAMRQAMTLEFDIAEGRRGERDDHLRGLLRELTGAEDSTVVNNNAAAVLLAVNTLAGGREVIASRGELIEIGGAFRMPEIVTRAGARLVEVGTTNRTHAKDYAAAIGGETGLILKVHTSNYRIEGFTKEVPARELAKLARDAKVPVMHDLGSGTLVDLARFGLMHEPTVAEAIADKVDLVTFSGDKLLGGPQAGFIVGNKDLIDRINRNPMKRALRVDKVRLVALEATLQLYRDPDSLAERLPTLHLLARPQAEIEALAQRLAPVLANAVGTAFAVEMVACASQIGSGALPLYKVPSAGLAIRPVARHGKGTALAALGTALRRLPVPIIGRIEEQALLLDLRCLVDEAGFASDLAQLTVTEEM